LSDSKECYKNVKQALWHPDKSRGSQPVGRVYGYKLRGRWQEICLISQQIGEDTQSSECESPVRPIEQSVKPKLDEMQMDLRDKEQTATGCS